MYKYKVTNQHDSKRDPQINIKKQKKEILKGINNIYTQKWSILKSFVEHMLKVPMISFD
jgi:hypothetical protein